MWLHSERVALPSTNPVSLPEVKNHLRIDAPDDDPLLEMLIRGAADHVEKGYGIALTAQQFDVYFDCFPLWFEFPMRPFTGVDSINYTDSDGNPQTVTNTDYEVDTVKGRVRPVSGISWPATKDVYNAVTVRLDVGYTAVPDGLKMAVLFLIGHWYKNRESVADNNVLAEVPMQTSAIFAQYRAGLFG